MSPVLQITTPPFIITLQGITKPTEMAKYAPTLLKTGIMHTVPCFEEVCVSILFQWLTDFKTLMYFHAKQLTSFPCSPIGYQTISVSQIQLLLTYLNFFAKIAK